MNIGVINEIESGEGGVTLMPDDVGKLVQAGHTVYVEKGAGEGIHISPQKYIQAGAKIVDRTTLIKNSRLILQIKPPATEHFRDFQKKIYLSMIHPPGYPDRVQAIKDNNIECIALEGLQDSRGTRLVECIEMCGWAVLYALQFIKKIPTDVDALVLGYGAVGSEAIKVLSKVGVNFQIVRRIDHGRLRQMMEGKDLIVNAIDWPSDKRAKKEFLVTEEMINVLAPDAVILDLIAHSGGGAMQSCRPTTLKDPTYTYKGRTHICLDPFPGLYPVSSSIRYSSQLLPIVMLIAENKGVAGIEERGGLGKSIHNALIV